MDVVPKENAVRNIAWILDCRSIQNADVGARLPKNAVDVLYGRYPDRKHCGGVNAVAPPGANLIKQATQRAIYYSTSEWCLARRKEGSKDSLSFLCAEGRQEMAFDRFMP